MRETYSCLLHMISPTAYSTPIEEKCGSFPIQRYLCDIRRFDQLKLGPTQTESAAKNPQYGTDGSINSYLETIS